MGGKAAVRKTTLVAIAVTVPLLIIAGREAGKLLAGLSGARQPAGPPPALWIGGILLTLVFLWVGVALWNRASVVRKGGTSFEMVAAMAIAEAKKRPAAGSCGRCGRARLSASSPRCLYCGSAFAPAAAAQPVAGKH
jgi:hypothetical protein